MDLISRKWRRPAPSRTDRRSWFTMAPRRRSSEADEKIIKQGCLIKSPPPYIFNKRASWKARLMKLCKIGDNSYVLRYYAYNGVSEEWKGEIPMSDIKSIEVGSDTMERVSTITRIFSISPNNILYIKTDKRGFYLVDEKPENIAEWEKHIREAWVKTRPTVTVDKPISSPVSLHQVIKNQDEVMRPKSYPEDYPHTETVLEEDLNRQRSHTDPEGCKKNPLTLNEYKELRHETSIEEKDASCKRKDYKMSGTCSQILPDIPPCEHQEVRRHSAAALLQSDPEQRRFSDEMTDPAYESEPEYSLYDTPRSIAMKMAESQDLSSEQEETSDLEDEVYQDMASISVDEPSHVPTKPPRNPPVTPKSSEQSSEGGLVSTSVTVPTEDLQRYMGIQEIGERLCVSKWKGPMHIGCLFHHGDHIESINEIRPGSKDFFHQMLENCITKEVTLKLKRNKSAAVFHQEGCSCDQS
ncbi:hypothetical protein GDO81_019791 [Engystomops pustulosus]|uniref:PH domain-containing protein n=2 Tax=Engystomops pustulosus TaxID=76066 RepID=A0AAV6ZUL4_ENGPU|nr:hypothetical protein GDO81_019791 [Engystomops pustulosus]